MLVWQRKLCGRTGAGAACGLPQAGRLANDLLRQRLNKQGYYETQTTPGLWRHSSRPIIFALTVTISLYNTQEKTTPFTSSKHYTNIMRRPTDWTGTKFDGINSNRDYNTTHVKRSCHLSMPGYIKKILIKYHLSTPAKKQLSLHPHLTH